MGLEDGPREWFSSQTQLDTTRPQLQCSALVSLGSGTGQESVYENAHKTTIQQLGYLLL